MILDVPFVLVIFALMIGASLFMMGGDAEADFNLRKQWKKHKEYRAYKRQLDKEWKVRQAELMRREEVKKKLAVV